MEVLKRDLFDRFANLFRRRSCLAPRHQLLRRGNNCALIWDPACDEGSIEKQSVHSGAKQFKRFFFSGKVIHRKKIYVKIKKYLFDRNTDNIFTFINILLLWKGIFAMEGKFFSNEEIYFFKSVIFFHESNYLFRLRKKF